MKTTLMGNGYIGSEFLRQNEKSVVVNERNDYVPQSPKVLYTISTTHNYHIFKRPHLDIDTNLSILIAVLENARLKYGEDVDFTFLSSWFVYGKQETFPVKENAPCNPTGFYSATKLAAERLLASYCETYGMKYRILRLCNVIGGDDPDMGRKKNALQYMITRLAQDKEINLYAGDVIRDYLDVRDVALAIKLAMNSESGETINIGAGGYGYNIKNLVRYAYGLVEKGEIHRIPVPDFHKTVQTDRMVLDVEKIASLGFVPQHTIHSTIKEIIKNAA